MKEGQANSALLTKAQHIAQIVAKFDIVHVWILGVAWATLDWHREDVQQVIYGVHARVPVDLCVERGEGVAWLIAVLVRVILEVELAHKSAKVGVHLDGRQLCECGGHELFVEYPEGPLASAGRLERNPVDVRIEENAMSLNERVVRR